MRRYTERPDDAEAEAELVAAVAGDREAFGPLLARWRPSRLCRRALGQAPGRGPRPREGGASLVVHGAAEASLVGHYAAAKATKDTDLMEPSMTELFPEEEVGGVMFLALDQSGWRREVALPFGFDQDPKAASERLARRHPTRSSDCWLPTAPTAEDRPIGGVERQAGEAQCAKELYRPPFSFGQSWCWG